MRIRTLLATALGLALALPTTVAFAQDQTRDQTRDQTQIHEPERARDQARDRDLLKLKDELQKRTRLSKADVETLTPELTAYLTHTRDRYQIREMVRLSLRDGCTGACLRQNLQTMNMAMEKGVAVRQARQMVTSELRAQVREHKRAGTQVTGTQLAEQVRSRVEARIETQQRLREPAREREKAMEETHQRTREQMREHEQQQQQNQGTGGAQQGGGQGRMGPGGGK